MRATAQLAAAADVEHAHLVAILLAEEHQRTGFLRVVDGHHARLGGGVGQHLGVDDGFDARHLLVAHRRVVGEVETRALGVHQRALLLHMRTQHLAQRLVHEVRDAVVAYGLRALLRIDPRDEFVADLDLAFDDAAVVAKDAGLHLERVLDDDARARIAQLADVTDLASAFGIERRVVEHDDHVVAGMRAWHRRAIDVDRRDLAVLAHQVFVAVEGRGRAVVVQPLRHLELGLAARLLALAFHGGVEAGAVHRDAALAADIGRQVEREAEGVVQLEGGFAVDGLRVAGQRGFQDFHAVGNGLEEALLFLLQHFGDAQSIALQLRIGLAHLVGQRLTPGRGRTACAHPVCSRGGWRGAQCGAGHNRGLRCRGSRRRPR